MTRLVELRDAREQLVEVENRRHLAADLRKRLERFGVEAAALEQPRVHERHRHVSGELRDDGDVALRELAGMMAEDVQRADRPRLVPERHHELRLHAGHELDIAGVGRHVVHEQRLLARDGGADEADPGTQLDRPFGFRIPDRVGHAQLAAALLEQVDRERIERDQPADQPGDLPQQLVEVEHGRDLPSEVEERGDELAFAGLGMGWRRRLGAV